MPDYDGLMRSSMEKELAKQRARWAERWGEGLTDDEYKTLERYYRSLSAEYKGAITPRLELNLMDISKWRLERDKAVKENDTAAAKRYTDMIKATMDSEAMKVGDAKPIEALRVDGLADKLEKLGLMKNGMLSLKEVICYVQTDKGNFQMSRDGIDAMMLSMLNAYRFNNGLSEMPELPQEMRMQDKLGEFLEAPTKEERGVMMELGMVNGRESDN